MGLLLIDEKRLKCLLIKPNTRYNEIEESIIGEALNEKNNKTYSWIYSVYNTKRL
jgi:hypothetical protein